MWGKRPGLPGGGGQPQLGGAGHHPGADTGLLHLDGPALWRQGLPGALPQRGGLGDAVPGVHRAAGGRGPAVGRAPAAPAEHPPGRAARGAAVPAHCLRGHPGHYGLQLPGGHFAGPGGRQNAPVRHCGGGPDERGPGFALCGGLPLGHCRGGHRHGGFPGGFCRVLLFQPCGKSPSSRCSPAI